MIKTRGFTLIEVLVSMIILAIGLLGLAALQGISLRDNQDAYYYQQATLLAYEMQDRIRANGTYWSTNSIPTAAHNTACDSSPGCTAAEMAANDYWYWEDMVKNKIKLPSPLTTPVVAVSSSAQANTPCVKSHPTSLCLITRWGRANVQTAGKLSADSTFYLEVTP